MAEPDSHEDGLSGMSLSLIPSLVPALSWAGHLKQLPSGFSLLGLSDLSSGVPVFATMPGSCDELFAL